MSHQPDGVLYTDAEIDTLKDMWCSGKTAAVISKHLGRSRNSVMSKVNRLGLLGVDRTKPSVRDPSPPRKFSWQ